MIISTKGLELMKVIFVVNMSTFGSNVLLTLKPMDVENVALTKIIHIYVIKSMHT